MPPKGGKKAKGEGNTSDRSENISGDDAAGQAADDPPKRSDLTPTMPAFAFATKCNPFLLSVPLNYVRGRCFQHLYNGTSVGTLTAYSPRYAKHNSGID